MFLGGLPRRPDKAEAHKTLKQHLTILGLWICAIRAAPFIFSLVTSRGEKLELDFDDDQPPIIPAAHLQLLQAGRQAEKDDDGTCWIAASKHCNQLFCDLFEELDNFVSEGASGFQIDDHSRLEKYFVTQDL